MSDPKAVRPSLDFDGWASALPAELAGCNLFSLSLTTPPPISEHLARTDDGTYWLIHWDSPARHYRWAAVNADYAEREARRVAEAWGDSEWVSRFDWGLPTRRCRIVVGDEAASIDGKPFGVSPVQAKGLRLLIEADGEYINMTKSGIKPQRLQEKLPGEVVLLIEAIQGGGTRLSKKAWQI